MMRHQVHHWLYIFSSAFFGGSLLLSISSCTWFSNLYDADENGDQAKIEQAQENTKSQDDTENIDWDTIWFSEIIQNSPEPYTFREPVKWDEIKGVLLNNSLDESDIRKLNTKIREHGSSIENEELGEALSVFRSLSNEKLRFLLFEVLFANFYAFQENPEVYTFFLEVANSDDRDLCPKALSVLIRLENEINDNGEDRWDDWSWSPELQSLFEQAVNDDLYKLSHISIDGDLLLLRLFERFPNSKLTRGARLYGQMSGGETYVGAYLSLPDDVEAPVLRIPISSDELEIWSSFLVDYPGHSASDNVMYRVARIYELEGNYPDALIAYYQASKMPDGALSDVAKERVLFIADFLMNGDSLSKLSKDIEYKQLVPFLEYTTAVHLIREGNISSALEKLEEFSNKYEPKVFLGFITPRSRFWETEDIEPSSKFWENFRRQRENLELLLRIQSKEGTDSRVYQEASFWFYNQLTAYNYLWRGFQTGTFSSFIPFLWDGKSTSSTRLLNYDMVQQAGNAYDNQLGYLISIRLLESLLQDFPESKLREKALYSILVNYYWLYVENAAVSLNLAGKWQDKARRYIDEDYPYFDSSYIWQAAVVDTAYEFVELFPLSSMADDALLTIGEVGSDLEAYQALRKLLADYPNSDRREEAEKILESL